MDIDVVISAGRRIKEFYRNVTLSPTNEEEEEEIFQQALGLLKTWQFIWTLDLRFAKKVSKPLKLILIVLVTLLIFSGELYYFFLLWNGSILFNPGEFLLLLLPTAFFVAGAPFRYTFTYFFEDEISSTINNISIFTKKFKAIQFQCQNIHVSNSLVDNNQDSYVTNIFQKKNIMSVSIYYLIMMSVLYLSFSLLPMLNYGLSRSERSLNCQDFFLLIPFYDHIQSPVLYYLVYGLTLPFIWGIVELGIVHYQWMYLLCDIFESIAHCISKRMDVISENFKQEFEKSLWDEERGCDQTIFKNQLILAFERDLVKLIKEHRKFSMLVLLINIGDDIFANNEPVNFDLFSTGLFKLHHRLSLFI